MFGGLSLGAAASSNTAVLAVKQARPAAAPFDADLFSGAANGYSSHSLPMGIPQQVKLLRWLPFNTACNSNPCTIYTMDAAINHTVLNWLMPTFENLAKHQAPERHTGCAEQWDGWRHLWRASKCPTGQPRSYQHGIPCQSTADGPVWRARRWVAHLSLNAFSDGVICQCTMKWAHDIKQDTMALSSVATSCAGMPGMPWHMQQQQIQAQPQYGIQHASQGQYGQQPQHMQHYGQMQASAEQSSLWKLFILQAVAVLHPEEVDHVSSSRRKACKAPHHTSTDCT